MKPESSVIFFPCRDITETKKYYSQVLGLPVYKDLGSTVWFDCGYGYLAFVDYGPERAMASGACISFNLPTTRAVDEMYETLSRSDVPVLGLEGPPEHHPKFPVYSFFLSDPNGYVLEFQKTTYRIQLAGQEHVSQIADLYVRSWKKTYRGLLSQAYLDGLNVPDIMAKWSEYLGQPDHGIYVALEGELVLGFAAFMPYHRIDNCIYLDSLHVEASRNGEGIGSALIRAVQEEGRRAGCPQMGVCIVKGNDHARELYTKLGAEHYQDKVDDFTGETSYSEILVWNL